jgi:hypothetical protein
MRTAQIIGIAVSLLAGLTVRAADPYETVIMVPEIEVRAKPSASIYSTSKLYQNQRIRVIEEKDGWLAIEPPEGSFSWINDRFIKRSRTGPAAPGEIASVFGEQVPILVGSMLSRSKPSVIGGHLSPGAQVVIVGAPLADAEDGTWWPIRAMPAEQRFIPKEACQGAPQPVQTTNKVGDTVNVAPSWNQPAQGLAGFTPEEAAMVQQAEQAKAAGRPEAVQLYENLGRQLANTHPRLAQYCNNQAHFLRNRQGTSVPPGYQAGRPNTATYNGPVGQRLVPQPAGHGANYATSGAPLQGTLRTTNYGIDNKRAYLLDGATRVYVTEGPGVNLNGYVNRSVTVTGSRVTFRQDIKNYHMEATSVR